MAQVEVPAQTVVDKLSAQLGSALADNARLQAALDIALTRIDVLESHNHELQELTTTKVREE
jgi:hypothetical protein